MQYFNRSHFPLFGNKCLSNMDVIWDSFLLNHYHVCVCAWCLCVEVRGQLCEVGSSPLPLQRVPGSNSGRQAVSAFTSWAISPTPQAWWHALLNRLPAVLFSSSVSRHSCIWKLWQDIWLFLFEAWSHWMLLCIIFTLLGVSVVSGSDPSVLSRSRT